jgi:hypothetical protein
MLLLDRGERTFAFCFLYLSSLSWEPVFLFRNGFSFFNSEKLLKFNNECWFELVKYSFEKKVFSFFSYSYVHYSILLKTSIYEGFSFPNLNILGLNT